MRDYKRDVEEVDWSLQAKKSHYVPNKSTKCGWDFHKNTYRCFVCLTNSNIVWCVYECINTMLHEDVEHYQMIFVDTNETTSLQIQSRHGLFLLRIGWEVDLMNQHLWAKQGD